MLGLPGTHQQQQQQTAATTTMTQHNEWCIWLTAVLGTRWQFTQDIFGDCQCHRDQLHIAVEAACCCGSPVSSPAHLPSGA
jgi:hypothetical protein